MGELEELEEKLRILKEHHKTACKLGGEGNISSLIVEIGKLEKKIEIFEDKGENLNVV